MLYSHISCPSTHVSGLVLTSTSTVGVHTSSTIRSATLRFIRKMLVELRMSFVLRITMGTMMLPATPMAMITKQKIMEVIRMYPGMTGNSVPALPFPNPSTPEKFGVKYPAVMVLLSVSGTPAYEVAMVTVLPSSGVNCEYEKW